MDSIPETRTEDVQEELCSSCRHWDICRRGKEVLGRCTRPSLADFPHLEEFTPPDAWCEEWAPRQDASVPAG